MTGHHHLGTCWKCKFSIPNPRPTESDTRPAIWVVTSPPGWLSRTALDSSAPSSGHSGASQAEGLGPAPPDLRPPPGWVRSCWDQGKKQPVSTKICQTSILSAQLPADFWTGFLYSQVQWAKMGWVNRLTTRHHHPCGQSWEGERPRLTVESHSATQQHWEMESNPSHRFKSRYSSEHRIMLISLLQVSVTSALNCMGVYVSTKTYLRYKYKAEHR